MINSEQTQALKAQMKRKRRDWTSGVMRTCDYCGQHKYTVLEDDGSAICAPCCDAEHVASLENIAETMLAERDADKALIAELKHDVDAANARVDAGCAQLCNQDDLIATLRGRHSGYAADHQFILLRRPVHDVAKHQYPLNAC